MTYNTFGSMQSSGATMIGRGVEPKADAQGFVASITANTTRAAIEVGSNKIVFSGSAAVNTTRGDAVTMTDRMTIETNGNVTIEDGNLVVADGHGIDFTAADSGLAGATGHLLDDYEKGTYDLTITGATSGADALRSGYTAQSYVKIGSFVTVTGRYEVSGGDASGNLQFSLPFAIAGSLDDQSDTGTGSISFFRNGTWFSSTIIQAIGYPGGSVFFAAYSVGTGNESLVTGENCDAGYEGYITFQYRTA